MGAAVLAALAGLAACSGRSGRRATLPVSEVATRYPAAVDPANAAISGFMTQALAFAGGPPAALDTAARQTENVVTTAGHRAAAIAAPDPIQRDIADVVAALDTVGSDLAALSKATGNDIQPAIARVVADAGRETAADTVVRLALKYATTPTTVPAETVPPLPVTTAAPTTTSTSLGTRRTTTTRPRTTTTVRTSTTVARTTTTAHL
ncbi:MAG: hypothetical protein QOK39_2766 [Acidimicrobiaceae bacterium]|nr:hypothetical protein [Acidimicrobiaceae bacterium]